MAAPIANKITLPSDTANAGKNVRTQTRVVGGDTVHEHFFVPIPAYSITEKYFFASTQQSVSATIQDVTATAFFWLQMPVAATVTALVKFVSFDCNTSSTVVAPTAPVLSASKFTFTGTASGVSVTPLVHKTGGTVNQMIVRTAVTGMTISVVGTLANFSIPTVLTGVGQCWAGDQSLPRDNQSFQRESDLEIAPGEGLAIWQSVAGTASDPRRFTVQVEWFELDLT